ncbi:WXG100 family type VII secretion target [Nocardia sp. NPDC019395]|uniref:WXG100 family type VII secretion target n=1 Tax=Nocardia sp. NPDC019395 TaxID=3154686 RepID=UPI0033C2D721
MPEDSQAFQVDLDQLDNLTARAANFIGFLNDSLTGLEQRMATLHQTWGGETATAQADAFRKWSNGATDVREGVDAMRQAAVDAHTRYTTAIQTVQRILGPR